MRGIRRSATGTLVLGCLLVLHVTTARADTAPDDFRRAAGKLTIRTITPGPKMIRWTVPKRGCKLTYAMRGSTYHDTSVCAPRPAARQGTRQGAYMEGEVVLARDPKSPRRGVFSFTSLRTGQIHRGNRLPGRALPTGKLPILALTTDGRQWFPARTLTQVTQPSMLNFLPRLPASQKPGRTIRWTIREPGRAGSRPGRLRLVRWLQIGAQRALSLTASFRDDSVMQVPGEKEKRTLRSRTKGRYVVLESGRLLHGSLVGKLRIIRRGSRSCEAPIRFVYALRLVSACDGVTLEPFRRKETGRELALAGYEGLTRALDEADRKGVRRHIAAAVLRAHGARKVVDLLLDHARRFGAHAFGEARYARAIEARGRRITFVVGSTVEDYSQALLTTRVTMDRGRIVGLSTRRDRLHPDGAAVLLEVSPGRLFSRAAGFRARPERGVVLTTETAVSAPRRGFLLFRRGRGCCALRLVSTGKKRARYEWYYLSDARRGKLHRGQRGKGEVWEVETPLGNGSYSTKGSRTGFACGPIQLGWSAGDYVYLGRLAGKAERDLDVSVARVDAIEKVRIDAPGRVWLSKRWGKLPYRPAADLAARRRLFPR